eukprot:TRINITY_DN18451_c0_g1_i1.p1 TRINITY_DN18451_c0_g1~~TRINITY_DN18451_c0_g1_i1.p1  ORF type:complete len:657 (+),score=145.24 TRINITY_DN18451_c0_g1_i1:44-2014(+)
MKRYPVPTFPPEVTPVDLESTSGVPRAYGSGKAVSLAGVPLNIQPYVGNAGGKSSAHSSSWNRGGHGGASANQDGIRQAATLVGVIWIGGWFLGYGIAWPLYMVLDTLGSFFSFPPFSWFFGWMNRGAPMVQQQGGHMQELRLPADQVSTYVDSYTQQYGDAALLYAAHDGYPQLVRGLLADRDLGYHDFIDASDENGNTPLIYAAAKGYRQITSELLAYGADPDVANQGNGGRTALMESAGTGHKEIVSLLRQANASLDLKDDFQNTALHYAAYHGHLVVAHELLKGNPQRDVKNSYGHTPASYAAANGHKGISDAINRAPKRTDKAAGVATAGAVTKADNKRGKVEKALGLGTDDEEDDQPHLLPHLLPKKHKDEKHVKGAAERLHKDELKEFAPKIEKGGISDKERKALEDQIAKMRRQSEEAELKWHKKVVELLEASSSSERSADEARQKVRELQMNNTELVLRVQELDAKREIMEARLAEERQRADQFREDLRMHQREADEHKHRADGLERERELQGDITRRHQESLRRRTEEVKDSSARLERQAHDLTSLREDIQRRDAELLQKREHIGALERELQAAKGLLPQGAASPEPSPNTAQPASPPPSSIQVAPAIESKGAQEEDGVGISEEPTTLEDRTATDVGASNIERTET